MALKTFSPTSPGRRHLVLVDRATCGRAARSRSWSRASTRRAAATRDGRITSRFIGGGHKQSYRKIDFRRNAKSDQPAVVERLEYDPNRTAFIALIKYEDGTLSYILAPQRLAVGDTVVSGAKVDVKPGNAMPLAAMPVGTIVHNVEMKPGKGGQIARSAGSFVQLVGRDAGWAVLKLNSGETRKVPAECMATVGAVSNPDHMNARHRQGRPHALEGPASAQPLDRDEPGRPSQRWPYQGRQALGDAVGQADQGLQDPQEQADHLSTSFAPVKRSK